MTPLERAARALCKLEGNPENMVSEGKPMWCSYVPHVMAVIEAMHEPSFRMIEAGAEIIRHVSPEESDVGHQGDAASVWRFMIEVIRRDTA